MARFFRVNFGSFFLSSDGTENGTRCKLSVSGFDQLLMSKTGSVSISANGTPFVQLVDTGKKGVPLEITVAVFYQPIFEQLKELFDAANNDQESLEIEISGDPGSFSGNILPMMPKPITPGDFRHGRIFNTVIRVITT